MRVLGVDPGSMVTGWAVVDCDGVVLSRVASGTIRVGRGGLGMRLGKIYTGLADVIGCYGPAVLSLERSFLARNVQSAFRLGEARGVAMAAAAGADMGLHEYTPATIKKALVGYGRADKGQVQAAVVRLFGLTTVPVEDEADALAAAACHGFRRRYDEKVSASLSSRRAVTRRGRAG